MLDVQPQPIQYAIYFLSNEEKLTFGRMMHFDSSCRWTIYCFALMALILNYIQVIVILCKTRHFITSHGIRCSYRSIFLQIRLNKHGIGQMHDISNSIDASLLIK